MSNFQMNKINRAYINRLKLKGAKWLMDNIEFEEKALAKDPDGDSMAFVLYIEAMKKALAELELSE